MTRKARRVYAIQTRHAYKELIETTPHELEHNLALQPVTAAQAHAWVRKGYHHSTGLWIDGNFVRYAEAMEEGVA